MVSGNSAKICGSCTQSHISDHESENRGHEQKGCEQTRSDWAQIATALKTERMKVVSYKVREQELLFVCLFTDKS